MLVVAVIGCQNKTGYLINNLGGYIGEKRNYWVYTRELSPPVVLGGIGECDPRRSR